MQPENAGNLDENERIAAKSVRDGSQKRLRTGEVLHDVGEDHEIRPLHLLERLLDEPVAHLEAEDAAADPQKLLIHIEAYPLPCRGQASQVPPPTCTDLDQAWSRSCSVASFRGLDPARALSGCRILGDKFSVTRLRRRDRVV
jgi:hypothetical protein